MGGMSASARSGTSDVEQRRAGHLRRLLGRLRRDRSGAIAPLAAVVITTVLIGTGASIDISRLVTAHTQLQDAVDSADLALARMPANTTDADMKTKATAWITANVTDPNIKNLVVSTPIRSTGQVQLNATASINTTLASLLGVSTIPLEGHATVKFGVTKVELALVLDNTGSMNDDGKLASLKAAAKKLVETLQTSAQQSGLPDALKVAIVPFSMTVNVGSQYSTASWIKGAVPAAYGDNGDAFDPSRPNRFDYFKKVGATWGGCVESRPPPYDVQETAPTSADQATYFVPFMAPDEPDAGWYKYAGTILYNYASKAAGDANNWANSTKIGNTTYKLYSENNYIPEVRGDASNDKTTGGSWSWFTENIIPNHQNSITKYTGTPIAGTNPAWGDAIGPNSGCTVQPIQRLTTDVASVQSQIQSMKAGGDTEIPLGLVWGWHVLSHNAPFADGSAYGTVNTMKVVVLVTDGANTYGSSSNINGSHYTAYGYAAQERISSDGASGTQAALNTRLQTLCSNMKVRNPDGTWRINIYTVPLKVSDADTKALLQGCVTDPNNYLDVPNTSDLGAAFDNIAGSISALRVSH